MSGCCRGSSLTAAFHHDDGDDDHSFQDDDDHQCTGWSEGALGEASGRGIVVTSDKRQL